MAQQKMHCALQRIHNDTQKVSDGGKDFLSCKPLEQNNFRTTLEDCEVSSPVLRNSDHRHTILTFLNFKSNGHLRVIALPLPCLDRPNHLELGAHVNMDSLHLLPSQPINPFKVDRRKTQKGNPPTYSVKSFAARSIPGLNVQHQSRNKTLTDKVTKLNEFSSSSSCQSSFTCSDSSVLVSDVSNAIISSDMFTDSSRGEKTIKRNSRKKARKKGKQNKKLSSYTGSTEPEVFFEEYAQGNLNAETCGNNDLDHRDGQVSYATAQEVSLPDAKDGRNDFEGNSDDIITYSEISKICTSYSDDVDISEVVVPSLVPNFAGEHPVIDPDYEIKKELPGFSIFDGEVENRHHSEISCYDGIYAKGFSDISDSLVLDSVSVGSNSDDSTNVGCDVKPSDKESCVISLPELQGFSCRKGYISHQNSLDGVVDISHQNSLAGVVDIYHHIEGTKSGSQGCSSSGVQLKVSGRRGKQVKTVLSGYMYGNTVNLHGRKGKENNHSVWQKVQRNGDECNCELKKEIPLGSQFDTTLKDGPLVKRNHNVEVNISPETGDRKQLKNKFPRKLKRKTSPGSKQDYNCYSRKGSHANKARFNDHSKISTQQNETLEFSVQLKDKKRLSSVSRSRSQTGCSRVGFQTNRAESMTTDSINDSQVHSDDLQALERVHNTASGMNNQNMENQDRSLQVSHESSDQSNIEQGLSDQSNLPEVRSPVYLPHLLGNGGFQMKKGIYRPEHSKEICCSGSILQGRIPTAKNCTLINAVEENLASKSQNSVSSLNAEAICMNQSSGNVNCSCENESLMQSTRNQNTGKLREQNSSHASANCSTSVSECQTLSACEADSSKIAQAVRDACRVQLASEDFHMVTGGPVAEFERLLHLSSPVICETDNVVSCQTCLPDKIASTSLCSHQTPNISLGFLWQWYEKHGSYGLEVRAEDYGNSKRLGVDPFAFCAYFVPFLSAVQLFRNSKSHVKNNGKEAPSLKVLEAREIGDVGCLPIFSVLVPKPRTEDASVKPLANQVSSDISSVSAKENVSVQSADTTLSSDLELIFEYFEYEQPQQRRPLYERIQELVRGDGPSQGKVYGDPSNLNSINLCDLHPGSWYSVAWYPIYRIPDGNFRAAFLTYHSLGHWVYGSPKFDSPSVNGCIASPAVGLQSYNAQGECWFQPRNSTLRQTAESPNLKPSEILKDRLRTLEETASLMARAVVNKGNLTSVNRHPDYEFFLSRRR